MKDKIKVECSRCGKKITDKLDNHGFETANYIFNLCLECSIIVEDDIYNLINKK